MAFILSKKSTVYKRLPYSTKDELSRGYMQSMDIYDYQEALEEKLGKGHWMVTTQIQIMWEMHLRAGRKGHPRKQFSIGEY